MPPLLVRIQRILQQRGVWQLFVKVYVMLIDRLYDIWYGIETCKESLLTELSIKSSNQIYGTPYQAARLLPLRSLFQLIAPSIPEGSVLVDLGSGKGRVLLVASEFGFEKVVGIEFAHELNEIAKKNCFKYKAVTGVKTHFQLVDTDVVEYVFGPDENVIVMNNPFKKEVLQQVLENLSNSIQQHYRKVVLVYMAPSHRDVIESHGDFVKIKEGYLWGCDFALYSNL